MNVSIAAAFSAFVIMGCLAANGNTAEAQTSAPMTAASPAASPLGPRLLSPRTLAFETNATPDVYLQNRRAASAAGNTAAMLHDANGKSLGTTQGAWFGARGIWQSSVEDGMALTRVSFTGLIPSGYYSLFSRHATAKGVAIAPLDESGTSSSFVASPDGTAIMTVSIPQPLVRGDTILLVYHTSATDHPKTIGRVGVDAHVQLRLVNR
jgi:hypothetical protein